MEKSAYPQALIAVFSVLAASALLLAGCSSPEPDTAGADRTTTDSNATTATAPIRPKRQPAGSTLASEKKQRLSDKPALVDPENAQEAPSIQGKKLKGGTFRLSEHRGQVVLVNFWATWCAPCRQEIPLLIQMQKILKEKDFLILGVAADRGGLDAVRPYVKEHDINYPIVAGNQRLARKFGGVPSLPTTFVVGRQGRIRYRKAGMVNPGALHPLVERLLEE